MSCLKFNSCAVDRPMRSAVHCYWALSVQLMSLSVVEHASRTNCLIYLPTFVLLRSVVARRTRAVKLMEHGLVVGVLSLFSWVMEELGLMISIHLGRKSCCLRDVIGP